MSTPRMKFCLTAVKELSDQDRDVLIESLEDYAGLGLSPVDAQRKALVDLEDTLADSRAAFIAQLKEQHPDLFDGYTSEMLDSESNSYADPPADEAQKVAAGITGSDPVRAARWLADNAPSEADRLLATRVATKLSEMRAAGIKLSLNVAKVGDTVPAGLTRARGLSRYVFGKAGQKDASFEVWLNGPDVTGKVGTSYETLLHELLHAATQGAIRVGNLKSSNGTPVARSVADLFAVTNAIIRELNSRFDEARAGNRLLTPFEQKIFDRNNNAFANPDEVVTWAMTNREAQDWLEAMPYKGRSAWSVFVEAVRKALGLSPRSDTALSEIVRLTGELLDANVNELESLANASGTAYSIQSPVGEQVNEAVSPFTQAAQVSQPTRAAVAASFAKVPGAQSAIGQWFKDRLLNFQESPLVLRFMTNDQIAESFKLPALQKMMAAMGRMGSTANRSMERAAEVTKLWRALGPEMGVKVSDVMLKTTLAEANVSIKKDGRYLTLDEAYRHASNDHLIVGDTAEEKAAFAKLYNEWAALPPAAKKVYDAARDDLASQREEQRRAFFKQAADLYGPALRRALSPEDLEALADSTGAIQDTMTALLGVAGTKAEQKALAGLRESLRDVNSTFRKVRGPYFPLVRFGDHVVVVKSEPMRAAEMKFQEAKAALERATVAVAEAGEDSVEQAEAAAAEAREAYAKARKAMDTLKADETAYSVRFYESPAQAENARAQLQAANPEAKVYRTRREEYQRGVSGAAPAFIKKLEEVLASALDSGGQVDAAAKAQAMKSMRDLWLQQSPERSALRAELTRRGVDGVEVSQMLNGYAQHSRASAWRTSRLKYQAELTSGLMELGRDRESAEAMTVLNEMKKRVVSDLQAPNDSQFLQSASNLSYFWQLGLNPSYFITNATQSWLTSLPFMGGRHGYNAARRELADASKTVIALLKQASAESIRENGVLIGVQLRMTDDLLRRAARNPAEYEMLKQLTDEGVVDITAKHDLGMVADGTNRIPLVSHVFEMSGVLANYPELYNRLSTALAAHRLEVKRASETSNDPSEVQRQATQYASRVLNRTHFNYSQENAPSIMRGPVARLLFQFKRYQQGMIYLYAKMVNDAFITKDMPEAERKEARRALAYTLGSTLATSGLAGLPIAAPVAMVLAAVSAAFPDDDEPEIAQWAYNGMKDVLGETGGQIVGKGALSAIGLDLSGKIGQGSILNPVAFADTEGKDVLSKDWWVAVGVALAGPAASTWLKMMDGAGMVADGEVQRGLERMLPVAASNFAKAIRVGGEGEVSRRGDDVLMQPEEFGAFDLTAKALGFALVDSADMYENRAAFDRMVRERKEARTRLLRNAAEGEDVGDDVAEYNSRNPDFPITAKNVQQYLAERAKARQELREGMRVGKREIGVYNDLVGD